MLDLNKFKLRMCVLMCVSMRVRVHKDRGVGVDQKLLWENTNSKQEKTTRVQAQRDPEQDPALLQIPSPEA